MKDPDDENAAAASFDIVGARIGWALARLLARLETCDQLLDQAAKLAEPMPRTEQEKSAAKRLSRDVRREVDAEVSQLVAEFPSLTEAALDVLLAGMDQPIPESPAGTTPHPLAPDEAGAIMKFVVDTSLNSTLVERLGRFGNNEVTTTYLLWRLRAGLREPAVEVQGAALLPEIVSTFERYLGSLVRVGLTQHPRGLGELPSVPFTVMDALPDKEDIRRYLIDQKVASFLRDSPTDWQRALVRWTKIDMNSLGPHWERLNEAIQRRHVVTHNDGIADEDYLKATSPGVRADIKAGERLVCDRKYTSAVIRSAQVVAMVLGLRWARHFDAADPVGVVPDLVDQIYDMEKRGDYSSAYTVADAALEGDETGDDLLRVNWWLCHQQLGLETDAIVPQIEAWQPANLELAAARLALLRKDEALAEVLRQLRTRPGSSLRWRALREMPIFEGAVERSPAVRAAFAGRRSK